ncbi:translation initiation factor IF-6 [archaeon]|nr:translation initiation factor IF-6 [archaeon]
MNFLKTNFNGDTNIGLYGFATDKYCLVGVNNKKIKPVVGVPVFVCRILNLDFAGIFVAGNSEGIIINDTVEEYEGYKLKAHFSKILVLKTKYTAIGNLVMMNDNGAIVSPLLKKHRKAISEFFNIPCESTTIAKQNIIGNLGVATNRGCLVHPKIRKNEKEIIERVLGVKSDIGTVSFGSPYPRAGIIANSHGFVVSEMSSGPEMGRVTEALGFL